MIKLWWKSMEAINYVFVSGEFTAENAIATGKCVGKLLLKKHSKQTTENTQRFLKM